MPKNDQRAPGSLAQILAIMLLPLLLASFGAWEIVRGQATVAVALLRAVVFECSGLWFLDTLSAGEVKLVLVALAGAGGVLWGAALSLRQLRRAFGLFAPEPATLLGRVIAEAEAPGLFALVRELAHDQEAVMPQTVVAGALSGFFVTSHPQAVLGRVVSGRTLHICLPQLAVLSRAHLALPHPPTSRGPGVRRPHTGGHKGACLSGSAGALPACGAGPCSWPGGRTSGNMRKGQGRCPRAPQARTDGAFAPAR